MEFYHIFDIAFACVTAFFMFRGLMRGLTGEIMSLLGLLVSAFCGWRYARDLTDFCMRYYDIMDRTVYEVTCAAVIFIVVSMVFALITKILHSVVRVANLSFLDHALGAVSGAARAFVILVAIYGVSSIFPVIPSGWMKDSVVMRGAAVAWPPVLRLLSEKGWIDLSQLQRKNADMEEISLPSLPLPSLSEMMNAYPSLQQ
ncbi:hypothetical protein AGMMS49957_07580 [Synergistales bacterium]|nr:hypothetical protein AGMMS49957_07580 [Synergistales bacterium]